VGRSRAQSAPVVQFAEMMITDHTAANVRVAALATRMGVVPQDSAVRTQLHTQAMQVATMLSSIQDVPSFEAAYIQSQVMMHTMVLDLVNGQLLPLAQTAELRAELTGMRDAVTAHLNHARTLQASTADGGADSGQAH
jgi:putative membrane protein